MRGLPRLGTVLLVVTAGIGGCGGGASKQPDNASAKNRIVAYLTAFNRGDGPSACSMLTPQARAGVPHLSGRIEAPDCAGAIRELARISARLRSPRISVRVAGKRAIAKIRNARPPYQSDVLLYKEDGGWRIAYPPAVLERYKSPPGIPGEPGSGRPTKRRSGARSTTRSLGLVRDAA
jgi:hypothetical protein